MADIPDSWLALETDLGCFRGFWHVFDAHCRLSFICSITLEVGDVYMGVFHRAFPLLERD